MSSQYKTSRFTPHEKSQVAFRARSLFERLDSDLKFKGGNNDSDEILRKWCKFVADGDSELFEERLQKLGFSLEECRQKLAATHTDQVKIPQWVNKLNEILEHTNSPEQLECCPNGSEVPFFEVLKPILSYANKQMNWVEKDLLTESAQEDLVLWLAKWLSEISAHVFFIEFKTYIRKNEGDIDQPIENPSNKIYYDRFLKHAVSNYKNLFIEYSFLARIIVRVVDQWLDIVEEIHLHTREDLETIQNEFSTLKGAKKVTAIDPMGDPHHGGRRVLKIEFNNGGLIAYKPRNSETAIEYNKILNWINDNSDLPDFKIISIISRENHSWMEWVEFKECDTEEEVSMYYYRAGMIICLFYAIRVVDMHLQNVVAYADQPIIIDLETIAHPTIINDFVITGQETKSRDTVLRTGAVPDKRTGGDSLDISCFSTHTVEFESGFHDFENINTDAMDIIEKKNVLVECENIPRLDGEIVNSDKYTDEIIQGFEDLYTFILNNKQAITREDGPIYQMNGGKANVSIIYRNTRNYSAIRKVMTHQPNLRTGIEFGIKVESLAKSVLLQSNCDELWEIYNHERDILIDWNIPRLTAFLGSKGIYCGEEEIVSEFFEAQPVDEVLEQIQGFSEYDCNAQIEILKEGFGRTR